MSHTHPGDTNRLLGYPADARLLIVNADDFGMCHAVNEAVFRVLGNGLLGSTTLMVPCPWAPQAMAFLGRHPELSFGVHLTIVSEWEVYRWGPVAPRSQVPTLVDKTGRFRRFEDAHEALDRLDLSELEAEFRAQIEAVLDHGLKPTHLDWHALRIGQREGLFELLLGLARAYGLALRVRGHPAIDLTRSLGLPCCDHDFLDSYQLDPVDDPTRYHQLLRELPAGLSEWALHPGLEDSELLAVEGATRHVRQRDFDFLSSTEAQAIVKKEGIVLLDYRALQKHWA